MELLVVLVIIATLAAVAVPMTQTSVQRDREMVLRETLREVRRAIDRFHNDWRDGTIAKSSDAASDAGYPVSLSVLIDGVKSADATGSTLRYLRRLPRNPFAYADAVFEEQWLLIGYEDPPEAENWNGRDVYDVRARTERVGLDGTEIDTW